MIDVPKKPGLVGLNGQPLAPPRPPEKITAVKFIRKLADDMGGIHTPRGQAIHRLAGHFIKLQEELARCGQLKDLTGDHTPERIDAAAAGIYEVARHQMARASGGQQVPDEWPVICRDSPQEAEMYRVMALAALGGPVFIPVASAEDIAEGATAHDTTGTADSEPDLQADQVSVRT